MSGAGALELLAGQLWRVGRDVRACAPDLLAGLLPEGCGPIGVRLAGLDVICWLPAELPHWASRLPRFLMTDPQLNPSALCRYVKKYADGKKEIEAEVAELKKHCSVIRVLAHTQARRFRGD